VFSLTVGEPYEPLLERAGVPVDWAGRHRLPPLRVLDIAAMARRFRPHVVQAGHFFTNLYVAAAARACGATEIGAIRNDTRFDMTECGFWGRPLLRTPRTLVANSMEAAMNAQAAGAAEYRLHVLTNVIDLDEFDLAHESTGPAGAMWTPSIAEPTREESLGFEPQPRPDREEGRDRHARQGRPEEVAVVAAVARLVPAKRLDRFIRALARARADGGRLRGLIVGDGSERPRLEALAEDVGLLPGGIRFLGARRDVPRLLAGVDILALTSEHEGFPNVLLEAMAARLPVITTPAGDASLIVQNGRSGYVVAFDDEERLAARLLELSASPDQRRAFGAAGRAIVEARYRAETLAGRALQIYHRAARQQHRDRAMRAVETLAH
jgi:glycosyltransferase involved in cell wall biosynthesis